ncbi:hypothetical protein FOA52_013691 [Chlamydomonas sp. UWO 241]|nr:hypothetical protein FOA52_013691 [Chlamydomonas sp. UWO 241]
MSAPTVHEQERGWRGGGSVDVYWIPCHQVKSTKAVLDIEDLTDASFELKADVPGRKAEDISMELDDTHAALVIQDHHASADTCRETAERVSTVRTERVPKDVDGDNIQSVHIPKRGAPRPPPHKTPAQPSRVAGGVDPRAGAHHGGRIAGAGAFRPLSPQHDHRLAPPAHTGPFPPVF